MGKRRSANQRRSVVARFSGSGLSVKEFCDREGISAASLHRWREALGGGGGRGAKVREAGAPVFIDAGMLNPAAPRGARLEFKLDLGEGVVLHWVRN